RHRRERWVAAAAAGIAGRIGPGAGGRHLRHGAGERLALRTVRLPARKGCVTMADPGAIGYWTVPLAVLGGAIRVSTPFLFVSLRSEEHTSELQSLAYL